MDKKEASVLGIGILAAIKAVNGLLNKDSNHMRELMRSEAEDIANISNGMNSDSNENVMPGIALSEFVSSKYKIRFKYPRGWTKNPRYEDKYEGKNGYFEVSDFSGIGENIDEAVNMQVEEEYKPYGSNPIIRKFVVDGQPARVIYPSQDQSQFFKDRDTAIVIQYPEPINVDGRNYDYVVIWTTREFVPLIISTFKFVE